MEELRASSAQMPRSRLLCASWVKWQAGRSRMAPDAAESLSELNAKRQREGLTEAEQQESELLVRQYERAMLVRAQAAALLKQRGHDISSLLAAP